jgi:hypothetical protein
VSAVAAAVLLAGAALVWPRARDVAGARIALALRCFEGAGSVAVGMGDVSAPESRMSSLRDRLAAAWHDDPVEVVRAWRLRRRPDDLLDGALQLLAGIGPGLAAGLPPSRAIEVGVGALVAAPDLDRARARRRVSGHPVRASRVRLRGRDARGALSLSGPSLGAPHVGGREAGPPELAFLCVDLLRASGAATPVSDVWREWALRTGSDDLAFVAAAWRLSETTGAPLAAAVERAVRGMRDGGTRRGKVAAAVAGPRATVTVLTVLPLTGPAFGLVCGIDPVRLYTGSPLAIIATAVGLGLVWVGRRWSTSMVRSAVRR